MRRLWREAIAKLLLRSQFVPDSYNIARRPAGRPQEKEAHIGLPKRQRCLRTGRVESRPRRPYLVQSSANINHRA
ncbi:protein of unknown function [Candidatus Filomicrobium marinum]|uniref:Uncharacterized protein n=1 Tax=Candidatus Filomicrobium marinum TaxID=1608628 RepID=A0A0D6JCF1_9HYPH|nr:protein of unknown function [Candidatus Filomicrobium marinum]CPR17196.1 protein of unknown function [Candidatus Filomicrobium marinum]